MQTQDITRGRRRHIACGVIAGLCGAAVVPVAPPAAARPGGAPLEGQYLVTSNGDMAKTNEVFRDERTNRQVWTITSSCTDSTACTGHLTSSEGWSADLRFDGVWWTVQRPLPDWQPCPDGTAASADQTFRFWGVDGTGQNDGNTATLAGYDIAQGHSGDCGISRPLRIAMPLRVQRVEGSPQ